MLRCEGGWYGTAEPKYEAPKNYRFAKRMSNGQLRVGFKGRTRHRVSSVQKLAVLRKLRVFRSPSLFSCLLNFMRKWLILASLVAQIFALTHASVSFRLSFDCSLSLGNIDFTISRGHRLVSVSRASSSDAEVQVMFACLNKNVKEKVKIDPELKRTRG